MEGAHFQFAYFFGSVIIMKAHEISPLFFLSGTEIDLEFKKKKEKKCRKKRLKT